MRLTLVFLSSIVLLPFSLSAQKASPPVDSLLPTSSSIYLQSTLFGGNKYVQNGEAHPAGASFGKLRQQLEEVPQAYELAGDGSRIVTHGRLVSILGAAIGAATFFVHGDVANWSASIGGFLVAGIGGAIQTKGRNRINEAVWIYNNSEIRIHEPEMDGRDDRLQEQ